MKEIFTQLKSRKLPTDFNIFTLWLFKFNHFKIIVFPYKPKDKITVKNFWTGFIFLSKGVNDCAFITRSNITVKAILTYFYLILIINFFF